mmetsp:Transcript_43595/g.136789  ORF Transcript_43595/g.136789 Transcript_43595/m.136789 type:complete len:139 (-) Transcript_43595:835-1251(-)
MPVFLLKIKGDYDGVDSVVPLPNNAWMLDVQASDSDEVRTEVVVCEDEEVELTSGRGTANFKCKFPGSSKEASCSITTHADVRAINGVSRVDFRAASSAGRPVSRAHISVSFAGRGRRLCGSGCLRVPGPRAGEVLPA